MLPLKRGDHCDRNLHEGVDDQRRGPQRREPPERECHQRRRLCPASLVEPRDVRVEDSRQPDRGIVAKIGNAQRRHVHKRGDSEEVDPPVSPRARGLSDARQREGVRSDAREHDDGANHVRHSAIRRFDGDRTDRREQGDRADKSPSIRPWQDNHEEDRDRPAWRIVEEQDQEVAGPNPAARRAAHCA